MAPDNAELIAQIKRAQDALNIILEGAVLVSGRAKRTALIWYCQEANNSLKSVIGMLAKHDHEPSLN